MMTIKVKSTSYPPNRISEEQWMKEFNVGKRLNNPMDGVGTTLGEYLEHINSIKNPKQKTDAEFARQTKS